MRSIRLLPVVIFAALALLVFKGIGLVTNGGYVLTGTSEAVAAGGASEQEDDTPTVEIPSEKTLEDEAPTLEDSAPTLEGEAEAAAGSHGEESSADGEAPAATEGVAAAAETEHEENLSEEPVPAIEEASVAVCADPAASGSGEGEEASEAAAAIDCPATVPAVNENGDALATMKDAKGQIVPLQLASENSAPVIVDRLGERRAELDSREADIDLRTALLEAAEKRLDERAKALADLEAQVKSLVDEKQVTEDEGFKAMVSMYETMKPKEAAQIFDTLELPVMLRLARAISPRKMSPILAAMTPSQAQALTTEFATEGPTSTVADAGGSLSDLPQIVGE